MPKNVLLVDDDEMLRKMMNVLLARQGFDVITAEDGPSTLEHLKTHIPDIILLDVMMPGMMGLQFAAKSAPIMPQRAFQLSC